MTKSKYGGDKDGIGFYEMMMMPSEVLERIENALLRHDKKTAIKLLDINDAPRGN